jgi:nicotinate-nucleotide adenylyltransferase
MKRRVGIYSGSFDPIHKGHISYALTAIQDANLDEVYFVPETLPRHKPGITHIAHRLSMLRLATRAHKNLKVLELPDKRFSVASTMPRIEKKFLNDDLLFMVGSDVLTHMPRWPLINEMLARVGLIVSLRDGADLNQVLHSATTMPRPLKELHIIDSLEPHMNSALIRRKYRTGKDSVSVLPSINRYIKKNWLYAGIN